MRVSRDTTLNVFLPEEVNLKEVSERLFALSVSDRPEERIASLNSLYADLLSQGTQSEYFGEVLQFIGG